MHLHRNWFRVSPPPVETMSREDSLSATFSIDPPIAQPGRPTRGGI